VNAPSGANDLRDPYASPNDLGKADIVEFSGFCDSAGVALDTNGKSVGNSSLTGRSKPKKTHTAYGMRVERWQGRGILWEHSNINSIRSCGRVSVRAGGTVDLVLKNGVAGYAGLSTCGSVHSCPVCASKIQAVRREELRVFISKAAMESAIVFSTMTLRHRKGQSLAQLWEALAYCNQRVGQDKTVRRLREKFGRDGYIRTVEATHGDSGWHPHIHSIQIFDPYVTQEQLDELNAAEFRAWKSAAKKKGLGEPLQEHTKLDLILDPTSTFSDYFVKAVYDADLYAANEVKAGADALAAEVSGSTIKTARKNSRTPFEILWSFGQTGDLDDLDLWHEWEAASRGRRQLVWSPGLKKRYAIEEIDDAAIASAPVGDVEDVVFAVASWRPMYNNAALGAQLMNALLRGGKAEAVEFCLEHDIPMLDADDPFVVEDRERRRTAHE